MSTTTAAPRTSVDTTADGRRSTSPLIRFITLDALEGRGLRDAGLLVLRLGTIFIFLHGLHKASNPEGFLGMMSDHFIGGIAPNFLGWAVILGQLLLGFGIALGLGTRWCSLLLALMFAFIIFTVNIPFNGVISPETGGLSFESSLYYFIPAIVLVLTGGGRFSVDHILGRREA